MQGSGRAYRSRSWHMEDDGGGPDGNVVGVRVRVQGMALEERVGSETSLRYLPADDLPVDPKVRLSGCMCGSDRAAEQ